MGYRGIDPTCRCEGAGSNTLGRSGRGADRREWAGLPDRSSEAVVNNPPARAIHPYGRFALDLDSPSFLEPAAEQTTPKLTPVRRYTLPLRLVAAPLPLLLTGLLASYVGPPTLPIQQPERPHHAEKSPFATLRRSRGVRGLCDDLRQPRAPQPFESGAAFADLRRQQPPLYGKRYRQENPF
jgi:hypothetical protein